MIYDESTVFLVRETLRITLMIAAPILVAGVLIGLSISLFQTLTSINEQTLSFVPKIIVMVTVAFVLLPWIVGRLVAFASEMFLLF